jgi:hypothetical protein
MYYFCNYRISNEGSGAKEPDIPVYVDYGTLGSGEDTDWCLCEISFEETPTEIECVSDELQVLLDSAKCYPPALAISLHSANFELPLSKSDYSIVLIGLLKKYLRNQYNDSFFLAEAAFEELGYLYKGEFVWIVRFYPETDEVMWVSSDYFLYRNLSTDFKVSSERLKKVSI